MKKHFTKFVILSLVALLTACGSPASTPNDSVKESAPKEEVANTEENTSEPNDKSSESSEETIDTPSLVSDSEPAQLSADDFISDVSLAISDSIDTKNESIDNVSFENGDLRIYVTLGDPTPFTYEDLMVSRTSSITDEVLFLEEYFDQWETITVDFGDLGYIQNNHDNIQDDGYGAYFRQQDFVISNNN